MPEDKLQLLFSNKVKIIYPFVGITGFRKLLSYQNPFFSLASVEFCPGGVGVKTVSFDEIEEVNIIVYKGIPEYTEFSSRQFLSSGIIVVGDEGLLIHSDMDSDFLIPWPSGLTDILVVLDADEVQSDQVRIITFYAEHFKDKKSHKFLVDFITKKIQN